jgi:hypothetical protein
MCPLLVNLQEALYITTESNFSPFALIVLENLSRVVVFSRSRENYS